MVKKQDEQNAQNINRFYKLTNNKTMEKIIKKAIEGGWNSDTPNFEYLRSYPTQIEFWENEGSGIRITTPSQIVCDPLFWQALGKACGWKQVLSHGSAEAGDEEGCTHSDCQDWYRNALRFFEINLTQGWNKAVEYLSEITK